MPWLMRSSMPENMLASSHHRSPLPLSRAIPGPKTRKIRPDVKHFTARPAYVPHLHSQRGRNHPGRSALMSIAFGSDGQPECRRWSPSKRRRRPPSRTALRASPPPQKRNAQACEERRRSAARGPDRHPAVPPYAENPGASRPRSPGAIRPRPLPVREAQGCGECRGFAARGPEGRAAVLLYGEQPGGSRSRRRGAIRPRPNNART